MTLGDWRSAITALVDAGDRPVVGASIRAGALFDTGAAVACRWQLAPQSGSRLVRELERVAQAAGGIDRGAPVVDIAGNRIAASMLADLAGATPCTDHPCRIVRLGTDPDHADLRIDAAPVWRRAEPGDDPVLAALLADDLAAWSRACVGW
ncbi:hypothetical protein [Sphingomonas hankookensis]|uniref:hypothetical protein n=1 Tax=Sphingomonas hankookensis TaxID=563996 RepID=UPI003F7A8128